MGRRAAKSVDLPSKTLRRGNQILSSVKIQKKKKGEREDKSKISTVIHEKLCNASSDFKNSVFLERIDHENLPNKRVALGDKTNVSPQTSCDKQSKIISLDNNIINVNVKSKNMDTVPKSRVRQSPRSRPTRDLSCVKNPCSVDYQPNGTHNPNLSCAETVLRKQPDNESIPNNLLVDIQDPLQTSNSTVKNKHCLSASKTTARNVKSMKNCQNFNRNSTSTLIVCDSSKENGEDGLKVLSNQDLPSLRRRRSSRLSSKDSELSIKESADSKNSAVNQKNVISDEGSEKTASTSCVYSKVHRDTMEIKSLPVKEKLALYEFEVDENEPVVKRKQKRRVYAKKRNFFRDPSYHSSLKVASVNPKNSGYDIRTKKCKETVETLHSAPQVLISSVKEVQNLKQVNIENSQEKGNSLRNNEEKHVHFNDDSNMNVKTRTPPITTLRMINSVPLSDRNKNSSTRASRSDIENNALWDTPRSGGSRTSKRVRQRVLRENLENCPPKSPIARPGHGRTPLRKLKDLEQFSEFQPEQCGNGSQVNCNISIPAEPQNATTFDPSVGSQRILDKSDSVNRQNVEPCSKLTPKPSVAGEDSPGIFDKPSSINVENFESCSKPTIASHSTPDKLNSEKANAADTGKEGFWSPISVVQSPNLSSIDKDHKMGSVINSSPYNSLSLQSIPLLRRVLYLPRLSGGGSEIYSDKGPDKKWDVEDCFGFNDENEEEEVVPLFKIPSANKSISKRPFSSTPMKQQVKPLPTRLNVKQKIEMLSEDRPCKSPKLEDDNDKLVKSLSESSSGITPFSNPLKQTKLDFTNESVMNTSRTPNMSHKVKNCEPSTSPALFKDDEKTPTHFTQPPRRSYNRLIKKNLKFVGDDWIEVDEDDDESQVEEEKSRIKRTKKNKSNKKDEKEAIKWIKDFNNKCEEIEDFELCVE